MQVTCKLSSLESVQLPSFAMANRTILFDTRKPLKEQLVYMTLQNMKIKWDGKSASFPMTNEHESVHV